MPADLESCPHCGAVLNERKKPRSPQHHKFFFKAISAAFHQWPHNGRFLPKNEEHLRHWLLVEAGHCDIIGQNLSDGPGDVFRMADFAGRCLEKARSSGCAGFIEITGRKSMIATFPRTINWREVDQTAFAPVAEKVFEIIHQEIGVSADELVRGQEQAA